MAISNNGSLDWMSDGVCAKPENKKYQDHFFSADFDERYIAKNMCYTCPVRQECGVWALESGTIWGIWGGKDDNELRRILSVNADGNEIRRNRFPQCPYCSARTSRLKINVIKLPEGGRWETAKEVECMDCGTKWRSRSSANAVAAYFAQREMKSAKRAKKNEERLQKRKDQEKKERERQGKKPSEARPRPGSARPESSQT